MTEYVYKYPMPVITSDVIIWRYTDNKINRCPWEILLIERGQEPWKGMYALIGGHFDVHKDESIQHCAQRECKEEVGLDKPLYSFCFESYWDSIDRDPRGRYITMVFSLVLSDDEEIVAGDDAASYKWFNFTELPPMASDHLSIVQDFGHRELGIPYG